MAQLSPLEEALVHRVLLGVLGRVCSPITLLLRDE